jgi:phage-related tail fiber protein
MTSNLERTLEQSGQMVAEALEGARAELAELNQRRMHLEALIKQAEAMQTASFGATGDRPLTLHEAIAVVLAEEGNRWMTVRELGQAVNSRGLYRKKDGSAVEVGQVHARTKNYSHQFEKSGSNVRLLVQPETQA